MFSDRIRVAEAVCNETENYGKDDNWMGISNRTYGRLEHKREGRRGEKIETREDSHKAWNQYRLSLRLPGLALQAQGLQAASPFANFFSRKAVVQLFLAGSEVAIPGTERPSRLLASCQVLLPAATYPTSPAASLAKARTFKPRPVGHVFWDQNSQVVGPAMDNQNQPRAGPEGAPCRLHGPECQLHRCLNLRRFGLIDLGAKCGEFQPLRFAC